MSRLLNITRLCRFLVLINIILVSVLFSVRGKFENVPKRSLRTNVKKKGTSKPEDTPQGQRQKIKQEEEEEAEEAADATAAAAANNENKKVPFGQTTILNEEEEDTFQASAAAAKLEEAFLANLRLRMTPRPLLLSNLNSNTTTTPSKQFYLLHHMKTGGTSINLLISCGLRRLHLYYPQVNYEDLIMFDISECSTTQFERCMTGSRTCRENAEKSAVMSYCAPLFSVNYFGWLNTDFEAVGEQLSSPPPPTTTTNAVTVIRDPIDRVWSMYRYTTRSCYQCLPLTTIYSHIENGTTHLLCNNQPCRGVCMTQLVNHQVRNLLTSDPDTRSMTDQEKLDEAILNLRTRFVVVGTTDQLVDTAKMISHVHPWLNETWQPDDAVPLTTMTAKSGKWDRRVCGLPHANTSPSNNRCGADGRSHLDLGDEPNEETREVIMKYNRLDMKLYEEAKEMMRLQKLALGWD